MLVQTDLWGQDKPVDAEAISKFQLKKLATAADQDNFHLIASPDIQKLRELVSILEAEEIFWIDTETDGLNWWEHEICGVSITLIGNTDESFYIPVRHKSDKDKNFKPEYLFSLLKPVLEHSEIKKVFHNAKFDCHMFRNEGIRVENYDDTMILAHLVDENYPKKLNILAKRYLNTEKVELPENSDWSTIPVYLMKPYACKDTVITKNLWILLNDLFYKNYGESYEVHSLARQEIKILEVLQDAERHGIRIDVEYMKKIGDILGPRIEELEKQIAVIAPELNIRSSQQLVKFFIAAGIKLTEKTDKGAFKMGKAQLEKIDHPLSNSIIECATKSKLKSTFVDNISNLLDNKGRTHCNFLTTGTVMGRMSCNSPNLQNIPREDTAGDFSIRKGFITDPDYKIVAIDYNQMELRILAFYSEDPVLIESFKNGADIHMTTGSLIFEKEFNDVTGPERSIAKTINFGIIYGMGKNLLSFKIKVPVHKAGEFIQKFKAGYAKVRNLEENISISLGQRGYIFNQYKRRRRITNPGIFYVGLHSLISGCCADMIKEKMIVIHDIIKTDRLKSRMVLFVHDEIVFLMHRDEMDYIERFKSEMQKFPWCNVEMPADSSKKVDNWALAK